MFITRVIALIMIVFVTWSCKTQQKVDDMSSKNEIVKIDYSAGPITYIYKTNENYFNLVPVLLSDDKTKIISYPHPKDLYYKGKLATPINLDNGYLLDNRGVSSNVAFLNITYEEYSNLDKAPTLDELFAMIVDRDPLIELYNCGNRNQYKDEVMELNNIINTKQLKQCKKVK